MIIVTGNEHNDSSSNPKDAVSPSTNTLGKVMITPILFSALCKDYGTLGSLTLEWLKIKEKKNYI